MLPLLMLGAGLLLAACNHSDDGPATTTVTCPADQVRVGGRCLTLTRRLPSENASLANLSARAAFNDQPALEAIKAHYAFGLLDGNSYTGEGVVIAVIDDGIQHHEVFQDENGDAPRLRRVTTLNYYGNHGYLTPPDTLSIGMEPIEDDRITCYNGLESSLMGNERNAAVLKCFEENYDHGTAVASAAAANSASLLGAAPDATVVDIPVSRIWEEYRRDMLIPAFDEDPVVKALSNEEKDALERELRVVAQVPLWKGTAEAAVAQGVRYINYSAHPPRYLTDSLPTDADGRETIRQWFDWLGGTVVWQEAQKEQGAIFVVSSANDYSPYDHDRDESAPDRTGDPTPRENQGICLIEGQCTPTPVPDPTSTADPRPTVDTLGVNPVIMGLLPLMAKWIGEAGLMPEIPEDVNLEPSFLVVGSIDVSTTGEPGPISVFSNHCGKAKDYCVVAPGGIFTDGPQDKDNAQRAILLAQPWFDPESPEDTQSQYERESGTSFSAPIATGALAVLDQAFRNADGRPMVTPHEVRDRLMHTANREGIYSDRNIYGWGLIDLQNALTPQGNQSLPMSTSLAGAAAPLPGLGLALPQAALRGLANARIMVLDSQGFPFFVPAGRIAHGAHAAPSFALQGARADLAPPALYAGRLGFSAGDGGSGWSGALVPGYLLAQDGAQGQQLAAGAHLSASPLVAASLGSGGHLAMRLRLGGAEVSAMTCSQRSRSSTPGTPGTGASSSGCMALGWDYMAGRSWGLSLRTHRLDSSTGLYRYGLRCFGASCAQGGGATAIELGIGGFASLAPGLRLGWNLWRGWASDRPGTTDLVRYQNMGHRAASLSLQDARGRWSLYLQQPLRTTGTISVTLPHSRTPARQVLHRTHSFDLGQDSQPLRLGFSGRLPLARGAGLLTLNLGAERGLHALADAQPFMSLESQVAW